MRTLRAPKQRRITNIVFSPNSRGLLAQGNSAAVCWPSINDSKQLNVFSARAIWSIGYVVGTNYIAVSKGEEGVWTYPIEGGDGRQCELGTDRIQKVICSPIEPIAVVYQLAVYETPGGLCCYRIGKSGEWNRIWAREPNRGVSPYFSADGKLIWQIIFQGMMSHNVHSGESAEHIPPPPELLRVTGPSAISFDQTLAAKCIGRDLWIHSNTGGESIAMKNDGRKDFTAAAFHPSGQYLMVASNDGTVKILDVTTWRVMLTFDWKCGPIRCVAFSPDGLVAAIGTESTRIVVWDVDF